jgi:hypothetical protein
VSLPAPKVTTIINDAAGAHAHPGHLVFCAKSSNATGSRQGWGRDGHQIAAAIASRHLTAKAQACLQGLLPGQSLADVSTWADEIKNARRSTAPWYYADMAPGEKEFSLAKDCPNAGCVVSAIQKECGVLRD